MKLNLVEDWKQAWKWLSINCMVLAGAMQGGWTAMPDDLKQNVPHNLVSGITIAILTLGVIGRLVKQGGNNADNSSSS